MNSNILKNYYQEDSEIYNSYKNIYKRPFYIAYLLNTSEYLINLLTKFNNIVLNYSKRNFKYRKLTDLEIKKLQETLNPSTKKVYSNQEIEEMQKTAYSHGDISPYDKTIFKFDLFALFLKPKNKTNILKL
jgi:hypothetical protein